jgi:hypothetical protein
MTLALGVAHCHLMVAVLRLKRRYAADVGGNTAQRSFGGALRTLQAKEGG